MASRLINPTVRSGSGASAATGATAIPYQGKKANASVLQNGYFTTTTTTGEDGATLDVIRTLGTNFALQVGMVLPTQTEDVGAGAGYKTLTLTLERGGSSIALFMIAAPMIGLQGGTPDIIRWGGLAGPLMWLDEDDVAGAVSYGFIFTMAGFSQAVVTVLWQELRR